MSKEAIEQLVDLANKLDSVTNAIVAEKLRVIAKGLKQDDRYVQFPADIDPGFVDKLRMFVYHNYDAPILVGNSVWNALLHKLQESDAYFGLERKRIATEKILVRGKEVVLNSSMSPTVAVNMHTFDKVDLGRK